MRGSPGASAEPGWRRIAHRVEDGLLALSLTAMIGIAAGQIALRNAFGTGLAWADPVLRALVLWVGLLAALVATRADKHISVDVLSRFLSDRARVGVRACTALFAAGVSAALAYHSARFVAADWRAGTVAFLGLPSWSVESILPAAFALIARRYARMSLQQARAWLSAGSAP